MGDIIFKISKSKALEIIIMTNDSLEEYFRDTATVYGTLNMVCKQDEGSEKLLYMGLLETWYFTGDVDDR